MSWCGMRSSPELTVSMKDRVLWRNIITNANQNGIWGNDNDKDDDGDSDDDDDDEQRTSDCCCKKKKKYVNLKINDLTMETC